MLIKANKKGKLTTYAPDHAQTVQRALLLYLKSQNNREKIFRMDRATIKIDSVVSAASPDKSWKATATGSIHVGHTVVKTDQFLKNRPHSFEISYQSSKDDLGLPDVKVISCTLEKLEMNPAKKVGRAPLTKKEPDHIVTGPLVPTAGGKARPRVEAKK